MSEEKKSMDPATAGALISVGIYAVESALPYLQGAPPITLDQLKKSLAELKALPDLPETLVESDSLVGALWETVNKIVKGEK